ncbi:unnamed protein product [Cyclocybe aegerita]|uniref:Uncharacterized protein n=1 Tax=Cyclocybe aegerita TaxID=1973307 RepID=A0A8S0VZL5_CYCAE|nr:unnamed protein product [Cyclocybe aegerita]
MLLKLIPAHSEPTIHFSFSFADLPSNLSAPASWTAQLTHLMLEDLEVPTTMHSLDRSVGISCLLEEVAFDIESGQIRCRFVDGAVEEWGFLSFGGKAGEVDGLGEREGRKLFAALDGIIRNVKESTLEDERIIREREEKEREKQKTVGLERSRSLTSKTSSSKGPRHKKQRSLFMQLVSSIGSMVNLASPSASSHPSLPTHRSSPFSPSYPAQPSPPPHVPGTSPRARALRRAARSALVDTYRRFVLSELLRRVQYFKYDQTTGKVGGDRGGGFCVWILHSMRRRTGERLDQLLDEARAIADQKEREMGPSPALNTTSVAFCNPTAIDAAEAGMIAKEEPATTAVPLSFSDDEDEVAETETDGSSVHTPSSSSHFSVSRPPTAPSTSSHSRSSTSTSESLTTTLCDAGSQMKDHDRLNPPMWTTLLSSHLTGPSLHEYNQLLDLHERLWQLTVFAISQARVSCEETRSRLEVLAVRSKRRAWSVGALKHNSSKSSAGAYGLAMPFRSSPLARYSWTADDLEKERQRSKSGLSRTSARSALSASSPSPSSEIFPVYRPGVPPVRIGGVPSPSSDSPAANGQEEGSSSATGASTSEETDDNGAEEDDDPRPLIEREFELYEEFRGPSPIDTRGGARRRRRNHRRRGAEAPGDGLDTNSGLLFPVSEEAEAEGEGSEDSSSSSNRSSTRGRKTQRTQRTFMGCDEIPLEGEGDTDEDDSEQRTLVGDDDDGLEDPRELDLELGFGFDFHGGSNFHDIDGDIGLFDGDDDDAAAGFEFEMEVERPKLRPRVRTSSIFMKKQARRKGSGFGLTEESILCQPVSFASAPPRTQPISILKPPAELSASAPHPHPPTSRPLAISRASTPAIYQEPELGLDLEVDVKLCVGVSDSNYELSGYTSHFGVNVSNQKQPAVLSTSPPNVHLLKKSPGRPLPLPLPTEVGPQDADQEEFTLAMDLPRSVGKRKSGPLATRQKLGAMFSEIPAPLVC